MKNIMPLVFKIRTALSHAKGEYRMFHVNKEKSTIRKSVFRGKGRNGKFSGNLSLRYVVARTDLTESAIRALVWFEIGMGASKLEELRPNGIFKEGMC